MGAINSVATPPSFTRQGDIASGGLTVGNANSQGGGGTIGSDLILLMQADATNGSLLPYVYFIASASVANTAMTPCVGRVYKSTISTGSPVAFTNIWLLGEVDLPGFTAAGQTSAQTAVVWTPPGGDMWINPSYNILVQVSVNAAANTAWVAHTPGGKY